MSLSRAGLVLLTLTVARLTNDAAGFSNPPRRCRTVTAPGLRPTTMMRAAPSDRADRAAELKAKAEDARRRAEELKKIAESRAAAAMIAVKKANEQKKKRALAATAAATAPSTPSMEKVVAAPLVVATREIKGPKPKAEEPIPAYSAIIPINEDTIQFTAGFLGGFLAVTLGGGPLIALAAAAASNYISRKGGPEGLGGVNELVQTASRSSLGTYNFFAKLDAKYEVLSRTTDSLDGVISLLSKSDGGSGATANSATLNKVEEAIAKTTRQLEKFAADNDLVEGSKSALAAVGDVLETTVDKVSDANREYKISDRLVGAAKSAAERTVGKVKNE